MNPLPASRALEQYFLDARCRLLDVAAILDRIDRGNDASAATADPRMKKIRRALEVLLNGNGRRAELIQLIFSLDYDPN
jgi:hypothetical protein